MIRITDTIAIGEDEISEQGISEQFRNSPNYYGG